MTKTKVFEERLVDGGDGKETRSASGQGQSSNTKRARSGSLLLTCTVERFIMLIGRSDEDLKPVTLPLEIRRERPHALKEYKLR